MRPRGRTIADEAPSEGSSRGRRAAGLGKSISQSMARWIASLVCVWVCVLLGATAEAAEDREHPPPERAPRMQKITPRGLRIDATTRLTIEGERLGGGGRLYYDDLPLTVTVVGTASDERVEVDVPLPAKTSPGIGLLRWVGPGGVSPAEPIAVDVLPQSPWEPTVAELPTALHGRIGGAAVLRTRFEGKAGEPFFAEAEAQILGANVRPVLNLYDDDGRLLASGEPRRATAADSRLGLTLPAGGTYVLEVHEAAYAGSEPNHVRVKLGRFASAELVTPLFGPRDRERTGRLLGRHIEPTPFRQMRPEGYGESGPVPFPPGSAWTGPAAVGFVADAAEFRTSVGDDPGRAPDAPCLLQGELSEKAPVGRHFVRLPAGPAWRIDVISHRAGTQLDPVVDLVDARSNQRLGGGDDGVDSLDPSFDLPAAAQARTVRVVVRDRFRQTGPTAIYALRIRPADEPRLTASLLDGRFAVPRGGSAVVDVRVERHGFAGPIAWRAIGLPTGIEVDAPDLPGNESLARIVLTAGPQAPGGFVLWRLLAFPRRADGTPAGPPTPVLDPEPLRLRQPAWQAERLPLAVLAAGPLGATVRTTTVEPVPGGRVAVAIETERAAGFRGEVRIELLDDPRDAPAPTSEGKSAAPTQPNPLPLLTLLPSSLLVPPGRNAVQGTLAVSPEANSGTERTAILRLEALKADGETVSAVLLRRVERFRIRPVALLDGPPGELRLVRGADRPPTLIGTVRRPSGFGGPLWIAVEGLPPEVFTPATLVRPQDNVFRLPLGLAAGAPLPPGELRVRAIGIAGGHVSASPALVRTFRTEGAGEPPPPAGLRTLFEDLPQGFPPLVAGALPQPEWHDLYAGVAALRIPTEGLTAQHLPGGPIVVREQPGPGEFRYLRFAWRRQGGESFVVHLPAKSDRSRKFGEFAPSFAYAAGPLAVAPARAVPLAPSPEGGWTPVERDLFADFGPCTIHGFEILLPDGGYAVVDQVAVAHSKMDFGTLLAPARGEPPLVLFDEDAAGVVGPKTALQTADRHAGRVALRVDADGPRVRVAAGGLRVRENPGPGEVRFVKFAWKKRGGQAICVVWHAETDDPDAAEDAAGPLRRCHAGPVTGCFGPSVRVAERLPTEWTVVVRDLYADFGEFTLTQVEPVAADGTLAYFDSLAFGRQITDLAGP